MILERDIEKYLKKEVESHGGLLIKQTSISGIPDRIIVAPIGITCWVELKRPGEKPRKLQEHWINKLKSLGHEAVYLDSKEGVDKLIANLF